MEHNPHRPKTGNEDNAADGDPNVSPKPDQTVKVSKLRELFHGRFSEDGVAELLQHLDWNQFRAAGFLFKLRPDQNVENQDPKLKAILERLKTCKAGGLDDIKQLARIGKIQTDHRLFACEDCNHDWWRRVPERKLVSKCKNCKVKYDPIPKEYEWGWAIFHCISCGNTFSGFGQMNKTESQCFNCGAMIFPSEVRRPDKRGQNRSRHQHQCNAVDCHHRGGAVSGVWNQRCAHPRSRRDNNVLMASRRHISTGSTVDTFLPQTEASDEPVFTPSLGGISEVDEHEGRNSGGENND